MDDNFSFVIISTYILHPFLYVYFYSTCRTKVNIRRKVKSQQLILDNFFSQRYALQIIGLSLKRNKDEKTQGKNKKGKRDDWFFRQVCYKKNYDVQSTLTYLSLPFYTISNIHKLRGLYFQLRWEEGVNSRPRIFNFSFIKKI